MAEFLSSPLASVVFLFTLTGVLIAIGVFIVSKFRAGMQEQDPGSSEHLTDFRELYDRGELDETEYKTIKATLTTRLQKDLKKIDSEKMR